MDALAIWLQRANTTLPAGLLDNSAFLWIAAQIESLQGVLAIDTANYEKALPLYLQFLKTAKQLGNAAVLANAYQNVGTELSRLDRHQEAIEAMELARDYALQADRATIAYTHEYLARVYAAAGESARYHRAIDVAMNIRSNSIQPETEQIQVRQLSDTLSEKVYGMRTLGEERELLAMKDYILNQIEKDRNFHMKEWIPITWSIAHLALHNLEESVFYAREMLQLTRERQNANMLQDLSKHLKGYGEAGYGDHPLVITLREEAQQPLI